MTADLHQHFGQAVELPDGFADMLRMPGEQGVRAFSQGGRLTLYFPLMTRPFSGRDTVSRLAGRLGAEVRAVPAPGGAAGLALDIKIDPFQDCFGPLRPVS